MFWVSHVLVATWLTFWGHPCPYSHQVSPVLAPWIQGQRVMFWVIHVTTATRTSFLVVQVLVATR